MQDIDDPTEGLSGRRPKSPSGGHQYPAFPWQDPEMGAKVISASANDLKPISRVCHASKCLNEGPPQKVDIREADIDLFEGDPHLSTIAKRVLRTCVRTQEATLPVRSKFLGLFCLFGETDFPQTPFNILNNILKGASTKEKRLYKYYY